MKFPKTIHVTVDDDGRGDEWLQIHDGVREAAEAGERVPCALYQLVEVGTVEAPPRYVPPKSKRGKP